MTVLKIKPVSMKEKLFFVLTCMVFNGSITNGSGAARVLCCILLFDHGTDWLQWVSCIGPKTQQTISISYGNAIDQPE